MSGRIDHNGNNRNDLDRSFTKGIQNVNDSFDHLSGSIGTLNRDGDSLIKPYRGHQAFSGSDLTLDRSHDVSRDLSFGDFERSPDRSRDLSYGNLNKSHDASRDLSNGHLDRSHDSSRDLNRSHDASRDLNRSHDASRDLNTSHDTSRDLNTSHDASRNLSNDHLDRSHDASTSRDLSYGKLNRSLEGYVNLNNGRLDRSLGASRDFSHDASMDLSHGNLNRSYDASRDLSNDHLDGSLGFSRDFSHDASMDLSHEPLDQSAEGYLAGTESQSTLHGVDNDDGDGGEEEEGDEEEGEMVYSASEVSLAFTNSSLAYTVSEVELVTGWLEGKTPLGLASGRNRQAEAFEAPPPSSVSQKLAFAEDENKDRGNWSGRLDFVLSMLGYAVGLGNLWRFPYLCYSIYYNVIIAWAQFYFFASFRDKLPWADCDNPEWNTKDCSLKWPIVDCEDGVQMLNGTCYHDKELQGLWNSSLFEKVTGRKRVSASEEYWTNNVLSLSSGLFDPGSPRWHLTLSLFLAWIVTFLCLIRGIKTTGKVVYFTALFPYVVLIVLFFRGVTLGDGVRDGISFYIKPRFEKLGEATVWRDAANQIFYSLGPCWGGIITLSSYNRFHNNALRDTLIVGFGNSLTSLFGGFVIFSYLGYMAAKLNVDVDGVVKDGPGLAFIVYPEAVTHLPGPPFWSIAFFFMLILLGLDSQFATVETVLTGIMDQFPQHRKRKTLIILSICVGLFLLGLPLVTEGGAYLVNLMDTYAGSWSLMLIGLTETLAISYVYGIDRFFQDMALMYGRQPYVWWKICWMGLSPSLIVFILIFAIVDYSPATYGSYTYTPGGEALGWLMVLASALWIPICALYKLAKEDEGKTFLQRLRLQSLPNKYWGPALVKHRKLVDYVQDFVLDPEGDKRKLAYVNQAFAHSTVTLSDRLSMGTRGRHKNGSSFKPTV
ncbi:hypothetical protein EGW08_002555 [Elysia chlorotica]|uniref:Transporter n=1 Tax=Elysia chlorotica TaxID=188477 RepID=A0A433U7F7_ELYCH|nr:hypothetical protein EGW08_002555 [Elysia chlorotica]